MLSILRLLCFFAAITTLASPTTNQPPATPGPPPPIEIQRRSEISNQVQIVLIRQISREPSLGTNAIPRDLSQTNLARVWRSRKKTTPPAP